MEKKLNAEEILTNLRENNINNDDFGDGYVDWDILDLGVVNLVESYGGEGQGETYFKVYHFVNHDVYLKINGYYSSYSGVEFEDDPYEVYPIEKTIIVYE